MSTNADLSTWVSEALQSSASSADAEKMQAYMKTSQPFYGVKKPARREVEREMLDRFAPADSAEWEGNTLALWNLPHREEQYLAIAYARAFREHHVPESLELLEHLIRDGAWWDLVDEVAIHLLGATWKTHRSTIQPVMDAWVDDDCSMWIRRAAIIGQIHHKSTTDSACLFDFCLRRADEREFFIRKAIGWALRDYAKTEPEAVQAFVLENIDRLSPLSVREADRQLKRTGRGVQ